MVLELAKACLALTAVLTAWLLVQRAWRRAFSAPDGDSDALAGRLGCGQCERAEQCASDERIQMDRS